jgi:hypothetical protein
MISRASRYAIDIAQDVESDVREGRFCATRSQTSCNSLILNGEMSERSIEHAWKLILFARADAH